MRHIIIGLSCAVLGMLASYPVVETVLPLDTGAVYQATLNSYVVLFFGASILVLHAVGVYKSGLKAIRRALLPTGLLVLLFGAFAHNASDTITFGGGRDYVVVEPLLGAADTVRWSEVHGIEPGGWGVSFTDSAGCMLFYAAYAQSGLRTLTAAAHEQLRSKGLPLPGGRFVRYLAEG